MSRFHYFSHIEELTTGSLVLGDPFATPPHVGSRCVYALHQAQPEVLTPDGDLPGLGAFHHLLPYPRETRFEALALFDVEQFSYAQRDELASLQHLVLNANLVSTAVALAQPSVAPMTQPWSNPYRLEAYKCVGLALRDQEEPRPTLLVHDPVGELTLGLLRAAAHHLHFYPNNPPYRLILIQPEHRIGLARVFEGALSGSEIGFDEEGIPSPVYDLIAEGLKACLGTVVQLEPGQETEPFKHALDRLIRAFFLDDEDHVFLIQP